MGRKKEDGKAAPQKAKASSGPKKFHGKKGAITGPLFAGFKNVSKHLRREIMSAVGHR